MTTGEDEDQVSGLPKRCVEGVPQRSREGVCGGNRRPCFPGSWAEGLSGEVLKRGLEGEGLELPGRIWPDQD